MSGLQRRSGCFGEEKPPVAWLGAGISRPPRAADFSKWEAILTFEIKKYIYFYVLNIF